MIIEFIIIAALSQTPDDVDFGFFTQKPPQTADDVDFGFFQKETPKPTTLSAPFFPAQILPEKVFQSLPKVKVEEPKNEEIIIKTDKFGKRWQSKDEKALDKHIEEMNKQPFQAVDKFGQSWQSQNKKELDEHIDRQNKYYDSIYVQPTVPITSYTSNLNCVGYT
jgi:hypothetical protein